MSTQPHANRQGAGLHRVLGLGDELGTSLSSMAPTFTIGVSLGSLAAIAGPSMVILWAVAILPMLAIAAGFVALNVKDPRAGTAYTWAGEYMHPLAGFMAGWITVGGFTLFMGYGVQALGSTTLQVLDSVDLVSPEYALRTGPAAVIGVAWLVLLAWLAIRGVDLAARLQKAIVIIDLVVIIGICGWALLKGGGEPISWSWFNPFAVGSFHTFVGAMVATSYLYWGWDNALRLNEESRDGGKSAGRAAMYSLLVVVVVFMFCQTGFQHVTTKEELAEQGANGLVFVADRLAGSFGAFVAAVALLLSIIAVVQAIILAITRQTLAMSRDRVLGPVWSRIHPTYGTPRAGTIALSVIVTVIVAVNVSLGTLSEVISGALIALGMLATSYYTICALAIVWAFRNESVTVGDRVRTIYLPIVAAAALGSLTVYAFVNNWVNGGPFAYDASSPKFQDAVALGVVVVGIPIMLVAKYKRGSTYFEPRNRDTPLVAPL